MGKPHEALIGHVLATVWQCSIDHVTINDGDECLGTAKSAWKSKPSTVDGGSQGIRMRIKALAILLYIIRYRSVLA
jgi:hypothetical protein